MTATAVPATELQEVHVSTLYTYFVVGTVIGTSSACARQGCLALPVTHIIGRQVGLWYPPCWGPKKRDQ